MYERYTNLTRYENVGINRRFNLADGHAHQGQNSTQQEIVTDLPKIFYAAEATLQRESEEEFQQVFYRLAGQHSAIHSPRTMLCYSASLATDLVATYLSSRSLSVGLLQPCFDNLATILRRRQVELVPLSEAQLGPDSIDDTFAGMTTDAVFLTLPNNPTGFTYDEAQFKHLVELCVTHRKILILDCTFRFFVTTPFWDQYAVLEDSGVSYLVVEDTGKTWPTQDLKCSILASSADLYEQVLELHNDILLNVSPFILRLLSAYVNDTARSGLEKSIWRTISQNRDHLRESLRGTILVPEFPDSTISVEWIRISHPTVRSEEIVELLGKAQVGILPGNHFYWADHDTGSNFVRFALARRSDWFADSCRYLRTVLLSNSVLMP
ncbi:pyridoxal phosphate-dependent aminotransferase [Polymorphospora lycopeni]|uniref:Pyridoxal phosphate-dependent aminotransferase n=1 Tax=Polymorphospora lycopeni TaxID=3140240 RepID=A0ABV5CT18_9ACTN